MLRAPPEGVLAFDVTSLGGKALGVFAKIIQRRGIGPCREENFHHRGVTIHRCAHQWRAAAGTGKIGIRCRSEKTADALNTAKYCSSTQCSMARPIGRVWVSAMIEH